MLISLKDFHFNKAVFISVIITDCCNRCPCLIFRIFPAAICERKLTSLFGSRQFQGMETYRRPSFFCIVFPGMIGYSVPWSALLCCTVNETGLLGLCESSQGRTLSSI